MPDDRQIYAHLRDACASRGTTISAVLIALGKSTSSTGTWKAGSSPSVSIVMDIAEYLHMSLDDVCYGPAREENAPVLYPTDYSWLPIIHGIPLDRHEVCKDFLRTHMTIPEKNAGKMDA